ADPLPAPAKVHRPYRRGRLDPYRDIAVARRRPGAAHYLTVVENVTELHLLQQELSTQALHDVLTGLPNEQYLMSHLQEVLGTAGPSTMVTLCRLNLDNFSVITDGIDRTAGDALLRSVARRLSDLVDGQRAMVARLGADDFAIMIEDGPGRVDAQVLAASINETLCEPFYLGGRGLAVSAGVGVVHRLATEVSPAELVRAADATMHEAKRRCGSVGALYGPADARQRARYRQAADMPGGFESGEIKMCYQPVYALDSGWIVALQALVRWQRADGTALPHAECLALAERTGLVIELGRWIVHHSCGVQQVVSHCPTSGSPRMRVDLTTRLSQDPDLLAVVNSALSATGLPADQLRVGVPLATLARGRGDVLDNVRMLAELGVEVVLLGAGAGSDYLAYLEDLPVGAVEIAAEIASPDCPACRKRLGGRQGSASGHSPGARRRGYGHGGGRGHRGTGAVVARRRGGRRPGRALRPARVA
ncbi:MAG: EAL domain-containing protein, partial [Actinomycetota bacterium]|nr:EAL domain-containing protein [Actinomycetota bacterium]